MAARSRLPVYVLVFAGQAPEMPAMYALPPDEIITVGRAASCELRVDDATLARRHATLRATVGGEVELVDLAGDGRTQVNGWPIEEPRGLVAGDVVSLGAITLVVYAHPGAAAPRRRVLAFDHARERLAAEIDRATRYQRALGVVVIALPELADPAADELVDRVVASFRRMDVVCVLPRREVLAVLPELALADMRALFERLRTTLQELAAGLRAGYAVYPDDGGDPDALVAHAQHAARTAKAGTIASVPTDAAMLVIGGRSIVAGDPVMVREYSLLRRLAAGEIPILLTGETGTGKEVAAQAIHALSPRAAGPLVSLNCAAFTETLLESELFGYEKGAFTGAVGTKPGQLERASGGTLFLDEVGELSASAQAKLLRVLEAKRVIRVGGLVERAIDIRIVAATNRDLDQQVARGQFREDLFYRLGVARITLPPLRQRPRDLAVLARMFAAQAAAELGRPAVAPSPACLAALARHAWPGNVRELANAMRWAVATAPPGHELTPEYLPASITGARVEASEPPRRPLYEEIEELERTRIAEALAATGGVKSRAAQRIGMPLRTFLAKLERYGMS